MTRPTTGRRLELEYRPQEARLYEFDALLVVVRFHWAMVVGG
jgi:hypothetical protein